VSSPFSAGRRRFLAVGAATAAGTGGLMVPRAATPLGGTADAAEPSAPRHVIDAHTHFYDPTRPGGVPWPSPEDKVLHRTVLPLDWEAVVRPLGVTGTIVVEASPWVEDNQWLLDLAARERPRHAPGMLGIVGVVGNLPVGEAGCGDLVTRFARQPLFRGIRVNGDKLLAGLASADVNIWGGDPATACTGEGAHAQEARTRTHALALALTPAASPLARPQTTSSTAASAPAEAAAIPRAPWPRNSRRLPRGRIRGLRGVGEPEVGKPSAMGISTRLVAKAPGGGIPSAAKTDARARTQSLIAGAGR
jgi:hypothetical protein